MRINRLVLGRMLQKLGFEVLEAENGEVALQLWQQHRAVLRAILLDLQMPILDGWRTAERLRQIEAACPCDSATGAPCARTPIVACTALGLNEAWHEHATVGLSALHSGVDELLEKPMSLTCLVGVLSKYVAGLQPAQQQRSQPQHHLHPQQQQAAQVLQRPPSRAGGVCGPRSKGGSPASRSPAASPRCLYAEQAAVAIAAAAVAVSAAVLEEAVPLQQPQLTAAERGSAPSTC